MANKHERFLNLYEQNHEAFAKYCQYLTKNITEAEDLINDTLLACYKQLDKIEKEHSFLKYLIGIARRKFFNQQRRLKFRGVFNPEHAEALVDREMLPDTSAEIFFLHKALSKLNISQKEAIILFELEGFSLKEVAEIQSTNLSTVKSRIRRGKEKLKLILTDHYTDSNHFPTLKIRA